VRFAEMPVPEEEIQNIAYCPHCGNTAPQRLVFLHSCDVVAYEDTGEKSEQMLSLTYYVAICSTCGDLLLYRSIFDEEEPRQFSTARLILPSGHELDDSVPVAVREAYTEACRIQNIAPNAYAAMLRRALEAVCHDRGVSEDTLHKGLMVLVQRGELPATLAEMTSILRDLGNTGAHHSTKPIRVPMTWGMNEFFRAVVEYVYIAPSRIKAFRKRLP
jgi:hypothetical protein